MQAQVSKPWKKCTQTWSSPKAEVTSFVLISPRLSGFELEELNASDIEGSSPETLSEMS